MYVHLKACCSVRTKFRVPNTLTSEASKRHECSLLATSVSAVHTSYDFQYIRYYDLCQGSRKEFDTGYILGAAKLQ